MFAVQCRPRSGSFNFPGKKWALPCRTHYIKLALNWGGKCLLPEFMVYSNAFPACSSLIPCLDGGWSVSIHNPVDDRHTVTWSVPISIRCMTWRAKASYVGAGRKIPWRRHMASIACVAPCGTLISSAISRKMWRRSAFLPLCPAPLASARDRGRLVNSYDIKTLLGISVS